MVWVDCDINGKFFVPSDGGWAKRNSIYSKEGKEMGNKPLRTTETVKKIKKEPAEVPVSRDDVE